MDTLKRYYAGKIYNEDNTGYIRSDHIYIADQVDTYIAEHLSRWIPVSERLPERSGCTMAYCDGKVVELYFNHDESRWYAHYPPTHWQPLPPPPPTQEEGQ